MLGRHFFPLCDQLLEESVNMEMEITQGWKEPQKWNKVKRRGEEEEETK